MSGSGAISIHVPREGHDFVPQGEISVASISIHVPREGHDHSAPPSLRAAWPISIHVPREGHDVGYNIDTVRDKAFQSTCPVRGTTRQEADARAAAAISIHVPREGHDFSRFLPAKISRHFNPRAP